MKYLVHSFLISLCLLSFFACKKEDHSINTNVSPVTNIFYPADSAYFDLNKTSSIVFEWEQAAAADGNLVLYTVAFDKPDGDFSNPIYSIASDGNGLYNRATMTKETLNKVGKLAGLAPSQTGKLQWTVYSSKGVNKVKATAKRTINLQRPFGLDNPPSDVYVTGSATEAGTDVSKAIKLKQVGAGKYEIYTSLKAGTFHFVDKTAGSDINAYFISGASIKEGADEATVTGTDTKVYRISLDFNLLTATKVEIKEVGLWFAGKNKVDFTFNYTANGVWKVTNQPVVFSAQSWGNDERYKFRFKVNDGTADTFEWYGSSNSDNQQANAASPASYFYLLSVNSSQWDYCYKFNGSANNHNCDITVNMSPDKTNYSHEVVIK